MEGDVAVNSVEVFGKWFPNQPCSKLSNVNIIEWTPMIQGSGFRCNCKKCQNYGQYVVSQITFRPVPSGRHPAAAFQWCLRSGDWVDDSGNVIRVRQRRKPASVGASAAEPSATELSAAGASAEADSPRKRKRVLVDSDSDDSEDEEGAALRQIRRVMGVDQLEKKLEECEQLLSIEKNKRLEVVKLNTELEKKQSESAKRQKKLESKVKELKNNNPGGNVKEMVEKCLTQVASAFTPESSSAAGSGPASSVKTTHTLVFCGCVHPKCDGKCTRPTILRDEPRPILTPATVDFSPYGNLQDVVDNNKFETGTFTARRNNGNTYDYAVAYSQLYENTRVDIQTISEDFFIGVSANDFHNTILAACSLPAPKYWKLMFQINISTSVSRCICELTYEEPTSVASVTPYPKCVAENNSITKRHLTKHLNFLPCANVAVDLDTSIGKRILDVIDERNGLPHSSIVIDKVIANGGLLGTLDSFLHNRTNDTKYSLVLHGSHCADPHGFLTGPTCLKGQSHMYKGSGLYTISEMNGGIDVQCIAASYACRKNGRQCICPANWLFVCLIDWSCGYSDSGGSGQPTWAYKTPHSIFNVRDNLRTHGGEKTCTNSICTHNFEFIKVLCGIHFDASSVKLVDF